MSIQVGTQLQRLDQSAFGQLAFAVMRCLFDIRNDLGRFFDECIYKQALRQRYPRVELNVPLEVSFDGFHRLYWLDTVVDGSAVFDLKTVEVLTNRHRSWLVHTLMLTDLAHAKLVNLRSEQVQHEFVNNVSRLSERREVVVTADQWCEIGDKQLQSWLTAFLRSTGAGLDISLYEEAITHLYGGEEQVLRDIEVIDANRGLGYQKFRLLAPGVAFKVTALYDRPDLFERHVQKLFTHTNLKAVQWINVTRKEVAFRTLRK
jgi:GxxExxY protein